MHQFRRLIRSLNVGLFAMMFCTVTLTACTSRHVTQYHPPQVTATVMLRPAPIGQLAPETAPSATAPVSEAAPCCDPVTGVCTVPEEHPAQTLPPPRHIPGTMPRYTGPPEKRCAPAPKPTEMEIGVMYYNGYPVLYNGQPIRITNVAAWQNALTPKQPEPACEFVYVGVLEVPKFMQQMATKQALDATHGKIERNAEGVIVRIHLYKQK